MPTSVCQIPELSSEHQSHSCICLLASNSTWPNLNSSLPQTSLFDSLFHGVEPPLLSHTCLNPRVFLVSSHPQPVIIKPCMVCCPKCKKHASPSPSLWLSHYSLISFSHSSATSKPWWAFLKPNLPAQASSFSSCPGQVPAGRPCRAHPFSDTSSAVYCLELQWHWAVCHFPTCTRYFHVFIKLCSLRLCCPTLLLLSSFHSSLQLDHFLSLGRTRCPSFELLQYVQCLIT